MTVDRAPERSGPGKALAAVRACGLALAVFILPAQMAAAPALAQDGASVAQQQAELRRRAEAGDTGAMLDLYRSYRTLSLFTIDSRRRADRQRQALAWLRRAAAAGDVEAMRSLGRHHELGLLGMRQDREQALHWYGRAAEAGDAQAARLMARLEATPTAEEIADLRRRADAGDPAAMHELHSILKIGRGVRVDIAGARQLLQQAAEAGYPPAMVTLGFDLLTRARSAAEAEVAIGWYRKAAEAGDGHAMYLLGAFRERGRSTLKVPRDLPEAERWYRRAADAGHAGAMAALGRMHEHGLQVRKDREAALSWYRRAAELGDEDAAKRLARLESES